MRFIKSLALALAVAVFVPALALAEGILYDGNSNPACWGVSTADSVTPLMVRINPTTKGLVCDASTGATGLGKTEDSAHVTGDVGVMMFGLRSSTPTDRSVGGTNGDYEPGGLNATGSWWVQLDNTTHGTTDLVAADITATGGTTLAADDAAIAGKPIPIGIKAVANGASPTAVTAGDVAYALGTLERIPIVTTRHPNAFNCTVTVSTATTIQAVGGACAAAAAGLRHYVTDITFSTNAAGIAADSFNTLKSGTGGTCGAATAVFYQCMTAAATQATCTEHFTTPIQLPVINEICWINSTAGSKTLQIAGYDAP